MKRSLQIVSTLYDGAEEISIFMCYFLNESTGNCIEEMAFGKRMQEVGMGVLVEYTTVTTRKMTALILLSELTNKK